VEEDPGWLGTDPASRSRSPTAELAEPEAAVMAPAATLSGLHLQQLVPIDVAGP